MRCCHATEITFGHAVWVPRKKVGGHTRIARMTRLDWQMSVSTSPGFLLLYKVANSTTVVIVGQQRQLFGCYVSERVIMFSLRQVCSDWHIGTRTRLLFPSTGLFAFHMAFPLRIWSNDVWRGLYKRVHPFAPLVLSAELGTYTKTLAKFKRSDWN
jgi:hypothetical protein